MKDLLKDFYNACNPVEPASLYQFVDSDTARGSRDLSRQFLNDLRNIEGDFISFLFTGHLGCGKSSELYHLAEQLKNPDPSLPDKKRYFPIIMNAEDFIDTFDVNPTDVMLSVLAGLSGAMKKLDIQLEDSFLWKRLEDVKSLLLSKIKVSNFKAETSFPLAKVTADFKLLKSDPENRRLVREALGRDISPLKQEINLQFDKARKELREKKEAPGGPFSDFVLIIDNLEKIDQIKEKSAGYESHRFFFIENASQLTGLKAHVIYTVPLPLVIQDGNQLSTLYGNRPFVLPMIKIEEKPPQRQRYNPGWDTLHNILQKRAGDTPLESLIEKDALDFLIRYSGGHTRQLIMFIRSAISFMDGKPPINLHAAQTAVGDTVDLYSRMKSAYWPKLAALELSDNQEIDSGDDDIKYMLQQLIILEYRNGGSRDNPFLRSIPWYGVHPIVRELPLFKDSVKKLKDSRKQKR